jgi:heptosyltransferase-2
MNFLVIRFSSMGDVVLATSVFSWLKSKHPNSKIWFVTEMCYAGLFTYDSRLTKVVGVEKGRDTEALRELEGIEWYGIIDLQNNRRSLMLRNRLAPKAQAGIFRKLHPERLALLAARVNLYKPDSHVIARYAEAAGYPAQKAFDFPSAVIAIDEKAREAAGRFLPSSTVVRPQIALFPFSAWKNKEWPDHYYAFVGRYFCAKGWNVVIAGGPEDALPAERVKDRIGGGQCVSVAGRLSLYETACLVARCKLALGNDTGLCHLARACGVKTGVIYGPTTSHLGFFPYGVPPFRVFETSRFCRPCHAHGGNICFTGARQCLKKILPETVISGMEELFQENGRV